MSKKTNALKRFITASRWGHAPFEYKGNTELAIIKEMAVAAGFVENAGEVPGSTVADALNFLADKLESEKEPETEEEPETEKPAEKPAETKSK